MKVEEGNTLIKRTFPKHVREILLQKYTTFSVFLFWFSKQQWTWYTIRHWVLEDGSKKLAAPYFRKSIEVTSRREEMRKTAWPWSWPSDTCKSDNSGALIVKLPKIIEFQWSVATRKEQSHECNTIILMAAPLQRV